MNSLFNTLDKAKPVFDFSYKLILFLCKVMLIIEVVLATIMVVGRYVFHNQPPWCSDLILTCMVYMSMLSATLALRRGAHIRMNAFDKYLPEKLLQVLDLLAAVAVFAFAIIMVKDGWWLASGVKSTYSSMPWLSQFWLYFPIPLAGACMIVFQLESVYNQVKALFGKEDKE